MITGASRGIGRAIALKFAENGFAVAVNYSKSKSEAENLCNLIAENGGIAAPFGADISDELSVKKMVEDGRDCSEVLVQLAAVRAALGSVSRIILKDHIEHCIVHAVEENDMEAISELEHAIDKLLK